jgi:L-threonylcarbamoyladenylate synthase
MNEPLDRGEPGRVVQVDPERPDPAVLERAGRIIRQGGLVAFPTETVYGLGANALDATAVQKIYTVKRRAATDPLIVHLASTTELDDVAREVPEVVRVLVEHFWPGPLTVVLPKQDRIPDIVTAGLPTVAVRVPSHPVAAGLLRAAGVPIAAPSANLFMKTSATMAAHVMEDLAHGVDLILDGGPAQVGIESTVIAVESEAAGDRQLRLLRPGAVPIEEVMRVLAGRGIAASFAGGERPDGATAAGTAGVRASESAGEAQRSPGLLEKHYSPRATLLFFRGTTAAAGQRMRDAVAQELAGGRRVGLLLCHEDIPHFADLAGRAEIEDLGSCADLPTVAHRLFAAMRRLDARGVDVIAARGVAGEGLGRAIMDRLTRAAAGRVIDA